MRKWTLNRRPGGSIVSERGPRLNRCGAKQIVIPMTHPQYDEPLASSRPRAGVPHPMARPAPELFPTGFDRGYRLHGFGRKLRKLPGVRLRKL